MPVLLSNNAVSLLASSLNTSATALTISLADADRFPSPTGGDWFPVTLFDSSANTEILRCTSRTGAVLTVTRGQEGTAALSWPAGSGVELRATAAAFNALAVANASEVSSTPAGSIAATNVQAALNELDTEKAALAGATFTGNITAPYITLAGTGAGVAVQRRDNTTLTSLFYSNTGFTRLFASASGDLLQLADDASQHLLNVSGTYRQIWHAGNFNPALKADVAGQTFTGAIGATALTISSTAPTITMADTNGISRSIYADANLIGFLTSSGGWAVNVDNSGNVVATGNVTAFSDPRLKTGLAQISDALDKVAHLTGYTYERVDTGERQVGLLSTDVEAVVPEAVQKGGQYDAVNYGGLVGLLVEAIKELTTRVETLEAGHGRHGS
jgi:hypothetical protein